MRSIFRNPPYRLRGPNGPSMLRRVILLANALLLPTSHCSLRAPAHAGAGVEVCLVAELHSAPVGCRVELGVLVLEAGEVREVRVHHVLDSLSSAEQD